MVRRLDGGGVQRDGQVAALTAVRGLWQCREGEHIGRLVHAPKLKIQCA